MPDQNRPARAVVGTVLDQHVEDAALLRNTRSVLVRAGHVRLAQLARLDERIAAHLDGIAVAGAEGRRRCLAALESPTPGAVFVATVLAIDSGDAPALQRLLSLGAALEPVRGGLASAFGWVAPMSLKGIVRSLLEADEPLWRALGITASAMHRADLGADLLQGLIEGPGDALPATAALRAAVALGHGELGPACAARMRRAETAQLQGDAALAAVLLGQRGDALQALRTLAESAEQPPPDPQQPAAQQAQRRQQAATRLWLRLAGPDETAQTLGVLGSLDAGGARRRLICAFGDAGDPQAIPWLIEQMRDDAHARIAGEAFSAITGVDLAQLDLDRQPPQSNAPLPEDDPEDENVSLDEDQGLSWPDADRVAGWWSQHGGRLHPGARYFMGEPPTPAHCLKVLGDGGQRQRAAAAEWLCLLQPGSALFGTAAPAWRQRIWLEQLKAGGRPSSSSM